MNTRSIVMVLVLLLCGRLAAAAPKVDHKLVEKDGRAYVELSVDGKPLVGGGGAPLFGESDCRVRVTSEAVPEGCLLHYTVTNPTDKPATIPEVTIGSVAWPYDKTRLVDNWKNIRLRGTGKKKRSHNNLHHMRRYPGGIYSPVLGLTDGEVFVAAAMMFDPLASMLEVHPDYLYDHKADRWTFLYRFWDQSGSRRTRVDPKTGKKTTRALAPPTATLAPGKTLRFTVSLTAAPAEGDTWVQAYRPYRDFFQSKYGKVRYTTTNEPIFARSYGINRFVSEENPQGYGQNSAGDGDGRLDLEGWDGLRERVMRDAWAYGYRRMMIWQVAGSYRKHPQCNMVWEIGTGQSELARRTAPKEIKALAKEGMTMGFWWGRAFSVTGGTFDDGIRRPLEPDNPEHVRLTRRELDIVYGMGVRLIGLDASPHSVRKEKWSPSIGVYPVWMPRLQKWYPDMQWITETAACDMQHVWTGSFMWSRDVSGPCTFARYLIPGSESNVTVKRGYGRTDQAWVDQLIEWGYVPIVFNDSFNFSIRNEVLGTDDPYRYLDCRTPEAAVRSLAVAASKIDKLKGEDVKSIHPTDPLTRHRLVAYATLGDDLQKNLSVEAFKKVDLTAMLGTDPKALTFGETKQLNRHGNLVMLPVTVKGKTLEFTLRKRHWGGLWTIDKLPK